MIADSGTRREFNSGAVRDVAEGKGRCDLLPLDIVTDLFMEGPHEVMNCLYEYMQDRDANHLYDALYAFCAMHHWSVETMLLEVSVHFEEGALKYDERNWEKGIPAHCYVDSAVRHYIKYRACRSDERHDRAFCWNILCLLWTLRHLPAMDDLPEAHK